MRSKLSLILVTVLLLAADKPKEDPGKKELEKLQGNWTVKSYEREGRQLGEDAAKAIKFTFKDDKYELTGGIGFTGGKEGTHKLDPSKDPKTIDITPTDGRNKGKTFEGIYKLDGDKLTICCAAPGKDRPKEFATKEGSGTVLIVYEKDKK